jgi:hypothetical protein
MSDLLTQLAEAEARVSRLKSAIAQGPCRTYGHPWESYGGMNCGCEYGTCSIPVLVCSKCGDSDYGDNEEAVKVRSRCEDENNG